jgi:hypothetical protein
VRDLLKGQQIRSPYGTVWTVVKRWTRGHGGEVWCKIQSERGAVRNILPYEVEGWERVS